CVGTITFCAIGAGVATTCVTATTGSTCVTCAISVTAVTTMAGGASAVTALSSAATGGGNVASSVNVGVPTVTPPLPSNEQALANNTPTTNSTYNPVRITISNTHS